MTTLEERLDQLSNEISDKSCHLYVVECYYSGWDLAEYFCKIGITDNLHRREREIQNNIPIPIRYAASWKLASRQRAETLETRLQGLLMSFRLRGEWFWLMAPIKQMLLQCDFTKEYFERFESLIGSWEKSTETAFRRIINSGISLSTLRNL